MDGESLVLYCRVLRGLLNSHVGSVENGVDLGPTGGQMVFSRKASGRARAVANDQNAVAGVTVQRNVRLFKHICVDPTLDCCLRNSLGCLIEGLPMGTWSVQPIV